jgi:hypothetical protein
MPTVVSAMSISTVLQVILAKIVVVKLSIDLACGLFYKKFYDCNL